MKYGLFEHIHMAFGLYNAPGTFQRIIQIVFAGMTWCEVLAYLDDLFILGMSFEHHLSNLQKVFQRLREHKLKLKPKKCTLFQVGVKFLGHSVGRDGISVDPDKIETIKKWPSPKTGNYSPFLDF